MQKLLILLILVFNIMSLTGCTKENTYKTEYANNNYISINKNKDNSVIIDTTNITSTATLLNYEINDITIQLIAVRGTDNVVRIAFNTCHVCSPSPNAYFKQVGEYLECQNCGNRFHIDELGSSKSGCNPMKVEELKQDSSSIIIPSTYIEQFQTKFMSWQGPTKKDMSLNVYN